MVLCWKDGEGKCPKNLSHEIFFFTRKVTVRYEKLLNNFILYFSYKKNFLYSKEKPKKGTDCAK